MGLAWELCRLLPKVSQTGPKRRSKPNGLAIRLLDLSYERGGAAYWTRTSGPIITKLMIFMAFQQGSKSLPSGRMFAGDPDDELATALPTH